MGAVRPATGFLGFARNDFQIGASPFFARDPRGNLTAALEDRRCHACQRLARWLPNSLI